MAEEAKKEDEKEETKTAFGLGELRKLVEETVNSIVKPAKEVEGKAQEKAGEHTESRLSRSSDIADMVSQQVARMKEREERDTREKGWDDSIKKLVEVTAEKPPVERRRVHKIMGWGDNE